MHNDPPVDKKKPAPSPAPPRKNPLVIEHTFTDLDLAPAHRTQANLWKAKYFEMYKAVVQANKGIRRLRRKIDRLENPEGIDFSNLKGWPKDIVPEPRTK